ncbi:MAG: DeoR/GlpR family DNA-binding transcription regulator [Propionibacteriaceae bacterium]|jgi:DeoR/GlpR family transcriptional regulator of sugar metabolism|nr:DeoR/GlpR family DNA-binding transcription regulator [Propionibacteriaceae bacterium]
MGDRRSAILEYVIERERVDVGDLADRFAVSQVTIRKDLDHLERQGLVHREHGFAVAMAPDDLRSRLAYHHDQKRRIAAAAAGLVTSGDTVMIESGSCCALLAAELAATKRGVTIVTNSAFIADYVRASAGTAVVLLGGDYQAESQVTVGPLAEQCLAGFHVGQLFAGIDGYTPQTGFTARNHLRAAVVKAMAGRADRVILLTESAKFSRQGAVPLLDAAAVDQVVTDAGLPGALRAGLAAAGIALTLVPVE